MNDDLDEEETRMRAVLHLPKSESPAPPTGRHDRPRFVRDGEVNVTVVSSRHSHAAPTREAVGELERALAAEKRGRETAEKALEHARRMILQLQTQLAHAEIARREAAPPAITQPVPPPPAQPPKAPRRRAAKAVEDEAVAWWVPGWKERFRARQQGTKTGKSID